MERECPRCGAKYMQYSTTQTLCGACYYARATSKPPKQRKPLRRSQKPIAQRGKQARKWETFRDKVAIPYLDKKYGHVCSVEGCTQTQNLDVDHIKPRGSHPELRYDVTNLRYLCRAHHIERTGVVRWTKKEVA